MKTKVQHMITKMLLVLAAIIFLAPFYISFVYSFKTSEQITFTGLAFPTEFHIENFTRAIAVSHLGNAMLNSVITTIPTVIILTIICPMAAYVFGRNNSRFYNVLYSLFLAALLIPYQSIMLPEYINLKKLGLLNTFSGAILVRSAFNISYNILIFTGFIKTVPRELEEAAKIDGAGPYKTFWKIVFPLLTPITITSIVLNTLFAWNDFTISITILMKDSVKTLPLMLYSFFGEYSVELNLAFAAFSLAMIPVLILYFVLQKYIVSGIMSGAVKG